MVYLGTVLKNHNSTTGCGRTLRRKRHACNGEEADMLIQERWMASLLYSIRGWLNVLYLGDDILQHSNGVWELEKHKMIALMRIYCLMQLHNKSV